MKHRRRLRRLLPDSELIRRRAAGEPLRELGSDYDVAPHDVRLLLRAAEVAEANEATASARRRESARVQLFLLAAERWFAVVASSSCGRDHEDNSLIDHARARRLGLPEPGTSPSWPTGTNILEEWDMPGPIEGACRSSAKERHLLRDERRANSHLPRLPPGRECAPRSGDGAKLDPGRLTGRASDVRAALVRARVDEVRSGGSCR
jgi:hypothetical protein